MDRDPDRMNKFQKHNSRTEKVAVESSWGSRLTALRKEGALDVDGNARNKFQKHAANQPQPVAAAEPARVLKTRGGVVESSALTTARLAEENRKAILKAEASRPPQPVHVELSDEDRLAVTASWVVRHRDATKPDFLYESAFNLSQLGNAMARSVSQGKVRWDSKGLDLIHGTLIREGYYESPRRVRGMVPAPKQIPQIEPQVEPGGFSPSATQGVESTPELTCADSKKMSLPDLAKLVRAGYKNPGNKTVL